MADYKAGTLFNFHELVAEDIGSLHTALVAVADRDDCFIIRGAPREHVDLSAPVYRRSVVKKWGDDAHFKEQPRRWLMIDFDGIEVGNHIDLLNAPEAAVEEIIRQALPEQYHNVSFVWQLSSSAGTMDPEGVLSAHAWFWLDRPVGYDELRTWHKLKAPDVDRTVFRTVQALFTAPPIFQDCEDPLPKRIGLATRKRKEVSLPKMDLVAPGIKQGGMAATGRVGLARGLGGKLKLLGDGKKLDGFNLVLPGAVASYISGKLPQEVDECWLKERCRQVIEAAPKKAHRDPGSIARYMSDEYLDECIRTATAAFGAVSTVPLYSAPEMLPDEARVRIGEQLTEFFTHQVAA